MDTAPVGEAIVGMAIVGRRCGERALRKQQKARAARAKKLAQSAAAGHGEDAVPGRRLPQGAHRWIGESGVTRYGGNPRPRPYVVYLWGR